MNNVSKQIRQAYYDALNGNISVNVYKEDVPETEGGHHVVIRVESETRGGHKKGFITNPVVVVDVVGVFTNSVDPDVVDDIDDEVRAIIKPDVNTRTFNVSGIQISNIKAESSSLLREDDGTQAFYRKITRWTQRISHT